MVDEALGVLIHCRSVKRKKIPDFHRLLALSTNASKGAASPSCALASPPSPSIRTSSAWTRASSGLPGQAPTPNGTPPPLSETTSPPPKRFSSSCAPPSDVDQERWDPTRCLFLSTRIHGLLVLSILSKACLGKGRCGLARPPFPP